MNAGKYSVTRVIPRMIGLQFKAAPLLSASHLLMAVIHALTWVAGILTTQRLFDAIAGAAGGQLGFGDCVTPLLMLAGAAFGQQIMSGLWNFTNGVIGSKTEGYIKSLLHRKLQRVDPARFEDTAFLDDLNRAGEGIMAIPYSCGIILSFLSFHTVYFSLIGVYFFRLKPLLLLTLLLSFLPALLAQIVRMKVFAALEKKNAPLRREYEYYQKTLCDREYFKETRVLGAFRFFHSLFAGTLLSLTRKVWQAERKTSILQLLLGLTTFAGMALSSYILFTATMEGTVSVGAFATVFAALGQIFNMMQEIIMWQLGNVNRHVGKVANFVRVLDTAERTGADGTPDFTRGVAAESLSFIYPGRTEPAVRNVSLHIENGETVAIVGENGAGKSTLVRLLTGVYRPSAGRVTLGGLDTAQAAPQSLYQGVSGVFQKFQKYKMTLEENVSISDPNAGADAAKIKSALQEADFIDGGIGLDTMLSPEFDGIDLSGGQWQRLAIARGLYRSSGFIVLDEPTSAIDPIEETRIYKKFERLAQGKCAVLVTHRLGSAKLAKRIIVMDGGEIADMGTHDELLARPGKYADMWAAQAQWYQRADAR